jgi:hypothetical protein
MDGTHAEVIFEPRVHTLNCRALAKAHAFAVRQGHNGVLFAGYSGRIRRGAGPSKVLFSPDEITGLIALLRGNGELIASDSGAVLLPDPTDSKFLACAQAADAMIVNRPSTTFFAGEMWRHRSPQRSRTS